MSVTPLLWSGLLQVWELMRRSDEPCSYGWPDF